MNGFATNDQTLNSVDDTNINDKNNGTSNNQIKSLSNIIRNLVHVMLNASQDGSSLFLFNHNDSSYIPVRTGADNTGSESDASTIQSLTTTPVTTSSTAYSVTTTGYVKPSSDSKTQIEFACVGLELSEPDFQLYACSGSKITSWIGCLFTISMIIFGITKCLRTHGIINIIDIRRNGISFPKRPEFFVLLCSTLPTVISVLSRPLFYPLSPYHEYFILGWGMAQTRFFFDLFTRTASIYHLIYWVYRTPIINTVWRIYLSICRLLQLLSIKLAQLQKMMKPAPKPSNLGADRNKVKTKGRTSEWGYTDCSNKARGNNSKSDEDGKNANQNDSKGNQGQGRSNLIKPQSLDTRTNYIISPNQIADIMKNTNDNSYDPYMMNSFQIQSMMDYNPNFMNSNMNFNYAMNNPYQRNFNDISMNNNNNNGEGMNDNKLAETKPEIPEPTPRFRRFCKRLIPGFIYVISFIVTAPSVTSFEPDMRKDGVMLTRCNERCRSYFYYDLLVLICIPTLLVIIAFYYSALSKTQINKELKLTYRLRCYYVTFILLNIPMLVLMLTSIAFRLSGKAYRNIYGTGILIAMTAYHANFVLKPAVYTTGCNCICCSDQYLETHPKTNRLLVSFITPVAVKDREALLESMHQANEVKTNTTTTNNNNNTNITNIINTDDDHNTNNASEPEE